MHSIELISSLGFAVLHSGRFKLAPFAGIGVVSIGVSSNKKRDKIPELKELFKSASSYSVGASVDIKLGKMGSSRHESQNEFIRIRYGYGIPRFSNKYDGMAGNVHQFSIEYGFPFIVSKRNY